MLVKDQGLLDLDAASTIYLEATERVRRARVETSVPGHHGWPVDWATVPARPVYPKRWLSTALGLVSGLLLGWLAATLIEWRSAPRLGG